MAISNPPGDNRHLAIFRVASYLFCAPAHTIAAITDLPAWTRIPKAPPSILGAVNHRGQVVVVVSLRRKLGLEPPPDADRSQLIIAELATGLTGFVVDMVEDVRPPDDMQRHALAATEAIDIFDAYRVDGKRILLETTFQKLYDARETPPVQNGLEARLRKTQTQIGAPRPSTPAAETPRRPAESKPAPQASAADERKPDARRRRAGAPRRPVETAALPPPIRGEPQTAVRPSAPGKVRTAFETAPGGPALRTGRPPWYRDTLVAAFFLALTVALGAGVWLVNHQTGPRSLSPGEKIGAGLATHEQNAPPSTETTAVRAPQAAPSVPAAKDWAPTPSWPQTAPQTEEGQRNPKRSHVQPEPPAPALPNEVLRVETKTFTLTVERPGDTSAAGMAPVTEASTPATAEEIRHIVVRGDTLWDIAAHYLGDPFQYPEIAKLSRIRDSDLIYPNDVIHIVRRPSGNRSP